MPCYRNYTHAGYEAVIWNAQQCASLNLLLDRLRLLVVMDIIDIYIYSIPISMYIYIYLVVTPSWPPATPRSLVWSQETAASPVSGGRVSTMSQSCRNIVIMSYCHN